MKHTKKSHGRLLRATALLLCMTLLCPLLLRNSEAALLGRTLSLEQSQRMAISNSGAISKQNNQIILKRMKSRQASVPESRIRSVILQEVASKPR